MLGGVYTAASGMKASQALLETAAHQVANISTTGYKSQSVSFSTAPAGQGGQVQGTVRSHTQGALMRTDVPTDVAVQGAGYFQVETADGGRRYTRAGNFARDVDGFLRTASGQYALGRGGRVQIPAGSEVSIRSDGTVTATDAAGVSTAVDILDLALFPNEQGLTSVGDNLYRAEAAAGNPVLTQPGQGGAGSLQQGALELSNVDVLTESENMILAKRSFEANAKALQTEDEMLGVLIKKT